MRRPFEGLFGNSSELKMLEYLLPLDGIEFDIDELSKENGITISTTTRIIKKFVDYGILKSRLQENTEYYTINNESPIVNHILQINNILIENILGDEKLYEINDYWEAHR